MITRPLSLVGRRELFLFLGAYLLYSTSRYVSVGDVSTATDHARWVVDLQKSIGVNVESSVQAALDGTAVIWILNNLYLLAQMVVVPGTLIYLYRRNHDVYVKLRNTVLATWLIAMPIYALFPVAPPRLAGIGMLDTITSGGGVRLDSSLTTSFYNPLAAVPSLHAGFALAVGVALAAHFRNPLAEAAGVGVGADHRPRRRRHRQPLLLRHRRRRRRDHRRLRGRQRGRPPLRRPPAVAAPGAPACRAALARSPPESAAAPAGRIDRACPSGTSTSSGWSRAWCCTSARSLPVGAAGTRSSARPIPRAGTRAGVTSC